MNSHTPPTGGPRATPIKPDQVALRAIGQVLIAHCGGEDFALEEGGWRVRRHPCKACRALAEAVGIELEPASGPQKGA